MTRRSELCVLAAAVALLGVAGTARAEAPVPFNTCDPADLVPAAEPLKANTLIINGQMTGAGQERDFDKGVANGGFGTPQTSVAFRSVASPLPRYPNSPVTVRYFDGAGGPYLSQNAQVQYWNNNGFNFFYTAASSDLTKAHEINGSVERLPLFVPKCAADAALRMPYSQGLYLHEIVTILSYPADPQHDPWDFDLAVDRLGQSGRVTPDGVDEANARWESLDHWVMLAKRLGKKVIWSEPAQAWRALARDDVANAYFAKWGETLVPMFATNFESPSSGRLMGGSAQWARKVADRYGMPFGASVQSWYFREQTDLGRQAAEGFPTDSIVDIPGRHTGQPPTTGTCCVLDPLNHNNYQGYSSPPLRHNIRTYEQSSLPPTTANTQRLAQYGRRLGATFFQVEGTNGTYKVAGQPPGNLPENQGPVNDMAHGSDYLSGIRQFSDSDLRQAVSRDDIRTKPLYQLWNPYTTTHYYTTDTTAGIPREPSGTQAAACPSDNSPPPVGRYCYYSYDGKPEVTGFLATTQVAGTVPLRRYRNQASNGFYYVTDGDPRASSSRYGIPNGYVSDGILGYVVPATAGSVQIPGTQPWYWMREGTQSIAGKYDYFYTTDPLYQRLPALGSDYTYKDFGVNAWLFTHGPDDTTPPTITLSGGLYNKRDTYSVDGSYGLQVRSADGNPNGGDQARGSGIRRVDVFVRGARKFTTGDVPCTSPAGSCARTDNWTFNTNASPGGDQEVTVRATDHAGNSAESRFTVYTKRDRLQGDPTGAGDDATVTSSNPHPSLRWGIATETADFFDDPRFKSLEVNTVRRTVEWDVVTEALGAAPPQGTTDSTYYNLDVTAAPPVPLDISVLGQRNHPYNALLEVDRWMDRACPRDIADGRRVCVYQPLISFWFNKALGERGPLPSTAEYARGVAAFLARYPFVTMYTPWNEPNAPYQTSAGDPYAVARFYLNLAQQCDAKGCTVAAGNFFAGDTLTLAKHRWPMTFDGQNWQDNTNTNLNLKTYLQEFRSRVLPTRAPAAWAANDYKSGNHLRPGWLRQFVIGTQDDTSAPVNSPGANIWLVEQGGLYRVTKDVNGQRTEDYWVSDNSANAVVGRGTRAVRYYVGNPDSGHPGVMRLFPRISRFYLYQWRGDNGWDSGLIDYLSNSARTEFFCFRYKTNEQPGDRTRCDPANPINSGETNVFSP